MDLGIGRRIEHGVIQGIGAHELQDDAAERGVARSAQSVEPEPPKIAILVDPEVESFDPASSVLAS